MFSARTIHVGYTRSSCQLAFLHFFVLRRFLFVFLAPLAAQAVGLVKEVVPDVDSDVGGPLRARAQALAEQWAREGKGRSLRAGSAGAPPGTAAGPSGSLSVEPSGGTSEGPLVARLKAVNAAESAALAAAFLSPRFLAAMQASAAAKGKGKLAATFAVLRHTQPLWSRL